MGRNKPLIRDYTEIILVSNIVIKNLGGYNDYKCLLDRS